jgi:tRNA-specific 2-thiouridylase
MIKRAGEMMVEMGYDFIATGEVLNQRPMSQRRQAMGIVERSSEFEGRLVRPLCALLLEPSLPEQEGIIDRSRLLNLNGRGRKPQFELAKKYELKSYPSPAGGCLLTESGFCRRLADMRDNNSIDNERLVWMLLYGRHFRLPGGSKLIVGRNSRDNAALKKARHVEDILLHTVNIPGPTALLPLGTSESDIAFAASICASYGDHGDKEEATVRICRGEQAEDLNVPVIKRDDFTGYML